MGMFFSRRCQKKQHRSRITSRRAASKSSRAGLFAGSFESLEPRSMLAYGDLDTTFSNDGFDQVGYSLAEPSESVIVTKLQPDGKILVLGNTASTNVDFVLLRYLSDGSIDTSFQGGRVVVDLSQTFLDQVPLVTSRDTASDFILQPDGKIVVVGTRNVGKDYKPFTVRLNADGSLDSSFGFFGKIVDDHYGADSIAGEFGYGVAIQPDGKIVTVGGAQGITSRDFGVARYMPDGTIDTTFGVNGKVLTSIGSTASSTEEARSVEIQANGKIVVGGMSQVGTTTNYNFVVVRYNSDGSLDTTFDTDGIAITDFSGGGDFLQNIEILPDGRILAGGYQTVGLTRFAFAIYGLDGALDPSFSGDGKLDYWLPGTEISRPTNFRYQGDGKVIATGITSPGSTNTGSTSLIRFDLTGTVLNTWNFSVTINAPVTTSTAPDIAILPNGQIILATNGKVSSTQVTRLAKYEANGTVNSSFTSAQFYQPSTLRPRMEAFGSALQPDGKVLTVGKLLRNVGGGVNDIFPFIMRHHADGTLDNSFSFDGIDVPLKVRSGKVSYFNSVAVQPDGKIVAVGVSRSSDTVGEILVVRYNANGTLDTSFGTLGYAYIYGGVTTDYGEGREVEVLANGKILIASTSDKHIVLTRLNANGSVDTSFGTNGRSVDQVQDFSGTLGSFELFVLTDDKILLAGQVGKYSAMRFSANGTLDTTFDGDGRVPHVFESLKSIAHDAALQADGKILLVGGIRTGVPSSYQIGLARLNSNGSIDTTFDGDGFVFTPHPTKTVGIGAAIAVQANGNIVIAGTYGSRESDAVAVSYKSDGSLDTSFGTNGIVTIASFNQPTNGQPNSDEIVTDILLQADGKVLVIGSTAFIDSTAFINPPTSIIDDFGVATPTNAFLVRLQGDPGVNHNPISYDREQTLSEDSFVVDVLEAEDPDSDPLTFELLSGPTNGTLEFDIQLGSYTYTPSMNFSGTDQFEFRVSDGRGGFSAKSIVSFTILPENDNPIAESQSINVEPGLEFFGQLIGYDSDSTDLRFKLEGPPALGTLTILNEATGEFVYTAYPDAGGGIDSFEFWVVDDQGAASRSVFVTINIIPPIEPQNRAPVAAPQTLGTMAGLRYAGKLIGSDADQDPILYAIATQPTKGTLQMLNMATGTFTYTPSANSSGSDSFTFYVYDDQNAISNVATVSISIAGANHSVKAVLVNETLVITGTTNADNLVVSPNGSNYNVTIAGINTLVNGLATPVSFNNVKIIDAKLGDGADRFWVKQRITLNSLVMESGPGDDTIILGADPSVAANSNVQAAQYGAGGYLQILSYNVQTGTGNDKFYERYTRMASNRTLNLEDGNDTYDLYGAFSNGAGNVLLNAGTGDDIINVGYGIFGGVTNIDAGEGNDLVSAYANNFIGESVFNGSDGDDTLAFDVNRYGISAGIHGGSNIDFILFSRSVASTATVTLNAGTENDELVVGRFITGSANGAFTYENGGSSIYSLVINSDAGNDRATIAANTIENLFAEFGDGDDDLTLDYNLFANMPSLVGGLGANKLKNLFSLVVNASDFTLVV